MKNLKVTEKKLFINKCKLSLYVSIYKLYRKFNSMNTKHNKFLCTVMLLI